MSKLLAKSALADYVTGLPLITQVVSQCSHSIQTPGSPWTTISLRTPSTDVLEGFFAIQVLQSMEQESATSWQARQANLQLAKERAELHAIIHKVQAADLCRVCWAPRRVSSPANSNRWALSAPAWCYVGINGMNWFTNVVPKFSGDGFEGDADSYLKLNMELLHFPCCLCRVTV